MAELLWILNDIDLKGDGRMRLCSATVCIPNGVSAVIGPSGAGKSSLLNLLVGYERQDAGTIEKKFSSADHGLDIYWVPQDYGLWPHLKVKDHLKLFDGDDAVWQTWLEKFDIADKQDSYPDQLSLGECARLAIVRALVADASVLIMDEPLANVDPSRRRRYWQLIIEEAKNSGRSLVFSSHTPEYVIGEAEHVVCLDSGNVTYHGPVEALYWQPANRQLAECLGETNWFSEDDLAILTGGHGDEGSYRPEQVVLSVDSASSLMVQRSDFYGPLTETVLSKGDDEFKVLHRHNGKRLESGTKVAVRLILSMVLMACFCLGCGKVGVGPIMEPVNISVWNMPAAGKRVPGPRCVTIDGQGQSIFVDNSGRVLVFSVDGKLVKQWSMPDTELGNPEGICVLRNGNIAVTDTHYHRVVIFSPDGKVVRMFGKQGEADGELCNPVGIVEDPEGNLYVCEYGTNDRVQKFTAAGKHLLTFGKPGLGRGEFQRPSDLEWYDGKIYVADAVNNRIQVFSQDGKFLEVLGEKLPDPPKFYLPYDIAMGKDGCLYVVEYGNSRLTRLDLAGRTLGRFGSDGPGRHQFHTPWGLAVDENMNILIADTGNRRIMKVGFGQ